MAIEEVMAEHGVMYAVVTGSDGTDWKEYGDKSLVPYQGIVSHYFPGPTAMRTLDAFLEGQVLPKTIVQDDVICVISRPKQDRITGLFAVAPGDIVTKMRKGRAIDASVRSLFP